MISSRICRTARLCRSTWRSRWEKPALPGKPSRCCGLISTVFKEANDLFGQNVGDDAPAVADRFRVAADGAYLARSGGGEFAFVIDGPQPSGAETLAERLRESIQSEVSVDEHSIQLGASIGVAVFPSHGGDVASLMANADAALQRKHDTVPSSDRAGLPCVRENISLIRCADDAALAIKCRCDARKG